MGFWCNLIFVLSFLTTGHRCICGCIFLDSANNIKRKFILLGKKVAKVFCGENYFIIEQSFLSFLVQLTKSKTDSVNYWLGQVFERKKTIYVKKEGN